MMNTKILRWAPAVLMLGLAACQQQKPQGEEAMKWIDPAHRDTTVAPGDNFFQYANGTWLKNNPVPPTETRWGSFSELQENNQAALRALLEEAASTEAREGTAQQKVGDLYRSGMDSLGREEAGFGPIQPLLDRIEAIDSRESLLAEVSWLHTQGLHQMYGFAVYPDDKNVEKNLPYFYQGGIGLPDRDYYFLDDERNRAIRDAYKKYQVDLLVMLGAEKEEARQEAARIYALEEELARHSMTRVELRDPQKRYNKYRLTEFAQQTPHLPWIKLFDQLKMGSEDSLIVATPAFFIALSRTLDKVPLETWKSYLRFHTANDLAPYLHDAVGKRRFAFYGTTLRGQAEQRPRWKQVLQIVDGSLGELLGQMYVEKHFRPEAKQRMMDLVNNLQQTYSERINRLEWMSEPTKQKAQAKLNTFMKKIGYPDQWRNYDALSIDPGNLVQNVLNAAAFEYDYMVSKLGKPVDKTEWQMTPPTVNAYYNPSFNEIVFPAGILQFPFFDLGADDAVNYGGIGAVIGHEMTHGFDDQGRQYDAHGHLFDWWTPEDAQRFNELARQVVGQYNQYTVLDSLAVNGELTLGENLADMGGLAIAYEAFLKTEQGQSDETIDGFTGKQRFFLSWAQIWRANTRDEEIASRIITDPHAPNEWRCNGPLSNMEAFYEAFPIKPGDRMYRPAEERVQVW